MAVQQKLYTVEDLLAMPEGDVRRELVRGEIIEIAPGATPRGELPGLSLPVHEIFAVLDEKAADDNGNA